MAQNGERVGGGEVKLVKIECLEGDPRLMFAGIHHVVIRQGNLQVTHFIEEVAIATWNKIATTINSATNKEVVR